MIEAGQLIARGLLITYRYAPGAGVPVVFLHGWRAHAEYFKEAMYFLSGKGIASYAFNLPGFGGSQTPPTPYSIDEYADVVSDVLSALHIDSAVVVGHSFGGRIGIVLAARAESKVSKLVLVDAAGIRSASITRDFLGVIARFVRPLMRTRAMQPLRKAFYASIGASDYLATPELTGTFKKVIQEDVTPRLREIHVPTLLIWGSNDTETPVSDGERMRNAIRGSRLIVYEGAGHFSFIDQPMRFCEDVLAFVI